MLHNTYLYVFTSIIICLGIWQTGKTYFFITLRYKSIFLIPNVHFNQCVGIMNIASTAILVSRITYKKGWIIKYYPQKGNYLQLSVKGTCSITGKPVKWVSGKKHLSEFMCEQEVVGVCFALIKAAEEHEMREFFRYKGSAIFNPHFCPSALAEFARDKNNYAFREDSMTKG